MIECAILKPRDYIMTVAIFSLGQLISSNLQNLKDGFETELANEGKDFSGEVVWKWMTSYLPRLRLNLMTLEELHIKFNKHFSSSISLERFTTHFNSMSKIDVQSLNRVSELNHFLNVNEDIYFLVVSHTNIYHLEFIMQQLESVMPKCRDGIIHGAMTSLSNQKMLFATSMYSQKEKHPDTLQCAIKSLNISLDQPVVSFLNTIQELANADEFEYIPANGMLDVDNISNEVSRVHTQNASSCRY
jgi:hypothetical protein